MATRHQVQGAPGTGFGGNSWKAKLILAALISCLLGIGELLVDISGLLADIRGLLADICGLFVAIS